MESFRDRARSICNHEYSLSQFEDQFEAKSRECLHPTSPFRDARDSAFNFTCAQRNLATLLTKCSQFLQLWWTKVKGNFPCSIVEWFSNFYRIIIERTRSVCALLKLNWRKQCFLVPECKCSGIFSHANTLPVDSRLNFGKLKWRAPKHEVSVNLLKASPNLHKAKDKTCNGIKSWRKTSMPIETSKPVPHY